MPTTETGQNGHQSPAVQSLSVRLKLLHAAQNLGLAPIPQVEPEQASRMSAAECQASRQLLLVTQLEAAQWLSQTPVSERAWQYWEAGRRPVPADVAKALSAACAEREQMLQQVRKAAIESLDGIAVGVWYAKADDWKWTLRPHGLPWKLHNSVLAQLASEGFVRLVGFDAEQYHAWSRAMPIIHSSGEMNRHGEWAAATLTTPQFFRKN